MTVQPPIYNSSQPSDNSAEEFSFEDLKMPGVVGLVALNWGNLLSDNYDYQKMTIGVDGGFGLNVKSSPFFVAINAGFHGLKLEKGKGFDGSMMTGGCAVGFTSYDHPGIAAYLNLHYAGVYDNLANNWQAGPEISLTVGGGLYLQGGVFIPIEDTENRAGFFRIGIGI